MDPPFVETQPKVQALRVHQKTVEKNWNPNKTSGDEIWVYYFEPQWRINNKQWLSKNPARPVIANKTRSAKKVLYAIFFNSSGPFVQIPCKEGKTITGKFYKNKYMYLQLSKILSK